MNLNLKKYNINNNEPIIIGCSSGPDSMALLHYLKHNMTNPLICAHINHNIRKESKNEEEYLNKYCTKNDITFESYKITNYKESNFENEARKKRYKFYEQILKKYNSHYLFLAHHGDDLIETILMKITRGSNLEGYAGIKERSNLKDYTIIRPLLNYTKEDLINYNKLNHIKYYIDKTNEDTTYTRNRYRKKILPLLKEENKNIHKMYLKYSKTLLEYHQYIEEETNQKYQQIQTNNQLNIDKLKKIHPFIQKNILFQWLSSYYKNPNLIKEKTVQNMINIINSKNPNLLLNLPKQLQVEKSYNTLTIKKQRPKATTNYKITLKKQNKINNKIIIQIKNTTENGNNICRLNQKELSLPLYIRNYQKGDSIILKGLNKHKKISDIFIEKKIPKQQRDSYPILVDQNDQIIWVPNLKKSKFIKQKDEFCDIILRYCEKEENNE